MSEWMLGVAQMLAVAVIVCGVTIAFWQVWVLAHKLAKNADREAIAAPTESDMHGERRSAGARVRYR